MFFLRSFFILLWLWGASALAALPGAVLWLKPATPKDEKYTAVFAYQLADMLGFYDPHLANAFMTPISAPTGTHHPLAYLYKSVDVDSAERLKVAYEALSMQYLVGGEVSQTSATLYIANAGQVQSLKVTGKGLQLIQNARDSIKTAWKLRLANKKDTLAPEAFGAAMLALKDEDYPRAVELIQNINHPLARDIKNRLSKPRYQADRVFASFLGWQEITPLSALSLPLSLPSLGVFRSLALYQAGKRNEAYTQLASTAKTIPYAAIFAEIMQLQDKKINQLKLLNTLNPQSGVLALTSSVTWRKTLNLPDEREKLAQKTPTSEFSLLEYSYALFERKDFVKVRDVLGRLTRLNPYDSLYWTNLGWATYETGDLENAIMHSEKALGINGEDVTAAFNLALFYALQGKQDLAEPLYLNTLKIANIEDVRAALQDIGTVAKPELKIYSALLHEQIGEYSEANTAIEEYLASGGVNGEDIATRLEETRCIPSMDSEDAWHIAPEKVAEQTVRAGEFIQSHIRIRCSGYLPPKLQLKYSTQFGTQAPIEKTTEIAVRPSTSGMLYRNIVVAVPANFVGNIIVKVSVTTPEGEEATLENTFTVAEKATLSQRLSSADIRFIEVSGENLNYTSANLTAVLLKQIQTLAPRATDFAASLGYPSSAKTALSKVTSAEIEAALGYMLNSLGALDIAIGSDVYFPELYLAYLNRKP